MEVHRQLGPGLLESAYEQCLARELALAQIQTYMKLADVPSGLLINFNVKVLKHGIRRLFPSPLSPPSL